MKKKIEKKLDEFSLLPYETDWERWIWEALTEIAEIAKKEESERIFKRLEKGFRELDDTTEVWIDLKGIKQIISSK